MELVGQAQLAQPMREPKSLMKAGRLKPLRKLKPSEASPTMTSVPKVANQT